MRVPKTPDREIRRAARALNPSEAVPRLASTSDRISSNGAAARGFRLRQTVRAETCSPTNRQQIDARCERSRRSAPPGSACEGCGSARRRTRCPAPRDPETAWRRRERPRRSDRLSIRPRTRCHGSAEVVRVILDQPALRGRSRGAERASHSGSWARRASRPACAHRLPDCASPEERARDRGRDVHDLGPELVEHGAEVRVVMREPEALGLRTPRRHRARGRKLRPSRPGTSGERARRCCSAMRADSDDGDPLRRVPRAGLVLDQRGRASPQGG